MRDKYRNEIGAGLAAAGILGPIPRAVSCYSGCFCGDLTGSVSPGFVLSINELNLAGSLAMRYALALMATDSGVIQTSDVVAVNQFGSSLSFYLGA